jgi:VanZ family protein
MGVGSVLIYMGVLGFGAMISPGVGIFGSLIPMFPQSVTEMSHLPAYGLLTWLLSGVLQGYGWPQRSALWVAIVIALVFGVGMEFLQGFVPGRVVDSGDVLMNSVGIGMATLLILWRSMVADKAEKLVPARSCHLP